jgi:hypothetical protein
MLESSKWSRGKITQGTEMFFQIRLVAKVTPASGATELGSVFVDHLIAEC